MTDFDKEYYWVVLCKNRLFHFRQNYRHKILLGVTDSFAPLPRLNVPFKVQCDVCGKEYIYRSEELLTARGISSEFSA